MGFDRNEQRCTKFLSTAWGLAPPLRQCPYRELKETPQEMPKESPRRGQLLALAALAALVWQLHGHCMPRCQAMSSHVKLLRRGDGMERTEREIARKILMKKLCMKKDLCFALACLHFGLRNRPKTFSASMKARWKLSMCARLRQQCICFLKQTVCLKLLCFQRPTLGLHSCRWYSCYLYVSCPGVDYEGRMFALLRLTSPRQRGQEMQL